MRRNTHIVAVGNIAIGGPNPIRVQSMTGTDTENIGETVSQIISLIEAGSELVRLSVNTIKAAKAVVEIKNTLVKKGITTPLIGDFHYNGNKILREVPDCAYLLDKYRINPGNVGRGDRQDKYFAEIIEIAIKNKKPVRIGINWGSLDQKILTTLMDANNKSENPAASNKILEKAMVQSALSSAEYAEKIGLPKNAIIISCKTSYVSSLISINRELSSICKYPLHIGLTEAGMGTSGIIHSSIGIGILLSEGIGDTIRVSLTPSPSENSPRSEEVVVSQKIIQALDLRNFSPRVISCPGCGRTSSDYFQKLAETINNWITDELPVLKKKYRGMESLTIAVMGCVVNGPGESKHADIGISLPGKGENPAAPVYMLGKHATTLKGDTIAEDFIELIQQHLKNNYQAEK